MRSNQVRRAEAREVLELVRKQGRDQFAEQKTALIDLLTNQLHLNGPKDVEEALRIAREHYRAESGASAKPTPAEYVKAARRMYAVDGTCEIDDGAPISEGDDPGAYVQAWVWVADEDVKH